VVLAAFAGSEGFAALGFLISVNSLISRWPIAAAAAVPAAFTATLEVTPFLLLPDRAMLCSAIAATAAAAPRAISSPTSG
jgi:hypothetical protein